VVRDAGAVWKTTASGAYRTQSPPHRRRTAVNSASSSLELNFFPSRGPKVAGKPPIARMASVLIAMLAPMGRVIGHASNGWPLYVAPTIQYSSAGNGREPSPHAGTTRPPTPTTSRLSKAPAISSSQPTSATASSSINTSSSVRHTLRAVLRADEAP
jgi:hypothetical protein